MDRKNYPQSQNEPGSGGSKTDPDRNQKAPEAGKKAFNGSGREAPESSQNVDSTEAGKDVFKEAGNKPRHEAFNRSGTESAGETGIWEPIPIPMHQKLREFRVRGLPLLVFLITGLLVAFLWEQRMHSPGLIGQVIADQSIVSSPKSGQLINFTHLEFEEIHEGQLLGHIIPEDSLAAFAELNVVRAQIEMIRQSLDPIVGEQRNRMNLEGLKIDHINSRISLAEDELRLQQARADYNRISDLKDRQLVSDQEYETAKTALDLLTVQVTEKQNMTEYLAERIGEIEGYGEYHTRLDRDPVLASIRVEEQRIEALLTQMAPVPVYAPMDGVISMIHHQRGEYVEAGLPVLEIESTVPTHIVGYVRQPFTAQPEVGMEVEVRTRKPGRDFFTSHIEKLGGHISLIREDLQRPGAIYESGLPIQIALENADDFALTPGEIVDIVLRPRQN